MTIAELTRYIVIEEKLDVHKLQYQSSLPDPDDPEIVVLTERRDLPNTGTLSDYPLINSTIFVCGPPPPQTPPPTFPVCVVLHDDERRLTVDAKLPQTLHEFREAVKTQHGVSIAEDVLILVDKELVGEDMAIWDLGFVPDCVVHAGTVACL